METGNFYLVRHGYDDHSYIDINNDPPLIEKGLVMARDMAQEIVGLLSEQSVDRVVSLRTSTKKRATETASIIAEGFDKAKVEYEFIPDSNLRELQQGNIINFNDLSHQQLVGLLEDAWTAFDSKRQIGDYDYHFGSPAANKSGEVVLDGFVEEPYGESQSDFSYRLASAYLDILENIRNERMPIAVTHRGGIREISNMVYSSNRGLLLTQSREFEMSGLKYCEIINTEVTGMAFALHSLRSYINQSSEE